MLIAVIRRAETTNRVTQGKEYLVVGGTGTIVDDHGNTMKPTLNNGKYWEKVFGGKPALAPVAPSLPPEAIWDINDTTESTKMKHLKIEDVTLVNGERSDTLDEGQIIALIQAEEAKIQVLTDIKFESVAIKRIVARHSSNIVRLVSFLDELGDKEC